MERLLGKHWHHLKSKDVLELLESDGKKGLEVLEIKKRQARYGPNSLTQQKVKHPFILFMEQFHQPLVYILLGAVAVTAALGEWIDSGVIFAVVLVNSLIGYLQEAKAVKAMDALAKQLTITTTVLRNGEVIQIPAEELVVGDIVILQSGDKVPADIRLVEVRDLQIDESALTGESLPVEKNISTLPPDTVLADRENISYASTLVTYGRGKGVVINTGDNTEIGRISQLISKTVELDTPLTKKIARFSHFLVYAILILAAFTFLIGALRGEPLFEMFMAAVALSVGAIPEGLPAAVTITLAIGVSRMAKRKAIIRKLPAVETLGSTTVICSDKTGTLTENQMTVQEMISGEKRYHFDGTGYNPKGEILFNKKLTKISPNDAGYECLKIGLLCNDSMLVEDNSQWSVQGDPTEGALIAAGAKAGLVKKNIEKEFPRIDIIPFSSEHKYMATLHNTEDANFNLICIKGATEPILERCSTTLNSAGEIVELDKAKVYKNMEELAAKGFRVLVFAKKKVSKDMIHISHCSLNSGMLFLGIQGMIDPPRREAIEAVEVCKTAGIQVKMITGDHPLTATSIAKQIGLLEHKTNGDTEIIALTGKELSQMTDKGLIEATEQTSVFARVSPEQKLRLVEAFQIRGHVVAMTGDGVNDAPALKRADIGIAMGITGTEVAKEASDMVLTNDNFASIEAAVEEGRGVFDNLTKFITWTLPTNLGEGMVILAAVMMGVVLPILPVQILWINMSTALLLGLMLAFEPKEAGIMTRPPRNPNSPILNRVLLTRIFLVGSLLLISAFGLFQFELMLGATIEQARTVAVGVFVVTELFYLFNCRSLTKSVFKMSFFSNPWVLGGVTIMMILQLLFTYLPVMNLFFDSAPISLAAWGRIFAVSIITFFIIVFEKYLREKFK